MAPRPPREAPAPRLRPLRLAALGGGVVAAGVVAALILASQEGPVVAERVAPVPMLFADDGKPLLGVVLVGGDSLAALRSLALLRMPHAVALGVDDGFEARKAEAIVRRGGGEVLLDVGTVEEGLGEAINPLLPGLHRAEALRRLRWQLANLEAPAGVLLDGPAELRRDAETMRAVAEWLRPEGLALVAGEPISGDAAGAVGRRLGLRTGDLAGQATAGVGVHTVLDLGASHAAAWGHALVAIPATEEGIAALRSWQRPGYVTLAPPSVIADRLRRE